MKMEAEVWSWGLRQKIWLHAKLLLIFNLFFLLSPLQQILAFTNLYVALASCIWYGGGGNVGWRLFHAGAPCCNASLSRPRSSLYDDMHEPRAQQVGGSPSPRDPHDKTRAATHRSQDQGNKNSAGLVRHYRLAVWLV